MKTDSDELLIFQKRRSMKFGIIFYSFSGYTLSVAKKKQESLTKAGMELSI
jgi:flavodoxin